jgi:hypothetical protein
MILVAFFGFFPKAPIMKGPQYIEEFIKEKLKIVGLIFFLPNQR